MREDGNLVGERLRVGEIVTVNKNLPREVRYNANEVMDLTPGMRFTISRIYTNRLIIRTVERIPAPADQFWASSAHWSFSVDRGDVMFVDPNFVPPPPPRKLGQKPEGDEYIAVNDPRIQWIWDDLGTYADRQSWCPQYDTLCRDVGVPGRPQDFNVTRTLNGVQIRATIKARSQQEANELFLKAISTEPAPSVSEPTPA